MTLNNVRKVVLELKTFSAFYAKTDGRIEELRKTINIIHAGTISLRKAATSCFPWTEFKDVTSYGDKGDMSILRLRLTSVPFKSIRAFATDSITAFLDKNLIAFWFTWPSPQ